MPIVAYSSLGRGLLSGKLRSIDSDQADQYLDPVAIRGYGCKDNYIRLGRCEELAKLKGCTVPQLAMAWILNQGLNVFAVCSLSSQKRIEQILPSLSIKLTEQESRFLNLEENT